MHILALTLLVFILQLWNHYFNYEYYSIFKKNIIENKMINDILKNSLILYITREIVAKFSMQSIINDFKDLRDC